MLQQQRKISGGKKNERSYQRNRLELAPQESLVLLSGYEPEQAEISEAAELTGMRTEYTGDYRISLAGYQDTASFGEPEETGTLYDIARKHPGFAGKVCYELIFNHQDYQQVLLENCREGVEVFLNGERLGARITAPYQFDLTGVKEGENHLKIILATTLVNAVPDGLSCQGAIPPTGILGPIVFLS